MNTLTLVSTNWKMLSFGVFFALFTVAVGSPTQSLLSGELGAEFTPHPGCHYNITGQAHFNFKVHNVRENCN